MERINAALDELGRRGMTNVLVEGGGLTLGSFFDAGQIDEVHAFFAPKLLGSRHALSPLGGTIRGFMADASTLDDVRVETIGDDVYLNGRVVRKTR